MYNSRPIKMV